MLNPFAGIICMCYVMIILIVFGNMIGDMEKSQGDKAALTMIMMIILFMSMDKIYNIMYEGSKKNNSVTYRSLKTYRKN